MKQAYEEGYEYSHWKEDGCALHDHCLTCPLPRCVHDIPGANDLALKRKQNPDKARELKAAGMSANEIAKVLGVTRRSVFRMVKER